MKIETKKLAAALSNLQPVVGHKRGMLPILSCVQISAVNGLLTIDATDMDQSQTETLEVEGDITRCCIDYKNLLMSLAGESVELTQVKGQLLIKSYLGTTQIATLEDDHPSEMKCGKLTKQGVNCADLANDIKAVDWCAAKPNQIDRPVLQAVHIAGTAKLMTVEATNGRNLAATVRPAISSAFEVLIPDGSCRNLCAAMERNGAVLSTGDNHVRVDFEGGHYEAKQIEGKFPNTAAIVGGTREELGSASVSALLEAFGKLNFYIDPNKGGAVNAEFFVTGLSLKMPGRGSALDFNIAGVFKEYACRLNVESFLEASKAFKCETVKISRNAAVNTIVLDCSDLSVHMTEVRDQPVKKA